MRFKYLLLPLIIWLFSTELAISKEQMIFVVDIIRHGDRTPTVAIPKVSHEWSEGLGQLTAKGMQQMYVLGAKMRKKYVVDHKLLPPNYNRESMYVRSTDIDRTLMSAQSLLIGLYPNGPALSKNKPALPNGYQPIPIHTVSDKLDTLLYISTKHPAVRELIPEFVFKQEHWQQGMAELSAKFARWSELTGFEITDEVSFIKIADAIYIHKLYKLPMPEGMNEEEIEEIINARDWMVSAVFGPKEIGEGIGGELLKKIADYMIEASIQDSSIQDNNKLKFVLFSAHDSTIMTFMSAIGAPLDKNPPYASDVNIALFKTEENEYIVKVNLNDEPVFIKGCGGYECSISQFTEL